MKARSDGLLVRLLRWRWVKAGVGGVGRKKAQRSHSHGTTGPILGKSTSRVTYHVVMAISFAVLP